MKKFLELFLGLMLLAGCETKTETFLGKDYVMTDTKNNLEISLSFSDDGKSYNGKVVNRYFGTYTTQGNQIEFGAAAATRMMGPEEEMEAESRYLRTLAKVRTYELQDGRLILTTEKGKVLEFRQTKLPQE